MNRQILITFLLPIILYCQECAKNPFLSQFYDFISMLPNQSLEFHQQMNIYLSSSSRDKQVLTTCTQFDKTSCCTSDFETELESIVQLYYETRQDQAYIFTKILNSIQIAISDCAKEDFQKIYESSLLSEKIFFYRKLVATLLDANVKFLRGNLCILCAPPTDYSRYIANKPTLSLILQKQSYETYINQVISTVKSLQSLIPEFKNLISNYVKEQDEKGNCSVILGQMNQYIDKLQFCDGSNCEQQVRSRTNVFKQEIDEDLIYLIPPDFRRVLSEANSFSFADEGLKTFITKESDSEINYQGVKSTDIFDSSSYRLIIYQIVMIIILS